MTKFIVLCVAASLLLIVGCHSTTSQSANGTSLKLVQPMNQTIVRGKTNDVMVVISRHNFSGPVSIHFDGLPRGVSVVDSNPTIGADSSTAKFTLRADADAAVVSNQYVRIVASGPDGLVATEGFKVSVDA